MKTFAVLLRGVMPTGKNKVPMAQLRQVLTEAGFEGVRTYIPGSAARSKLSNNFLEKKLGVSTTTRNYNTMKKLIERSTLCNIS